MGGTFSSNLSGVLFLKVFEGRTEIMQMLLDRGCHADTGFTSLKSCSKWRSCRHCSSFRWCLHQNCSKAFSVSSSWARSLQQKGSTSPDIFGRWTFSEYRLRLTTRHKKCQLPFHRCLVLHLVRFEFVALRFGCLVLDAGKQGAALS